MLESWEKQLRACSNSCGRSGTLATLIDWVSNESVGSPAFNFAVCVTNFVAAGSHFKNRSLTHVSFYRQLHTFSRYVQTVCLGCPMSYFVLPV